MLCLKKSMYFLTPCMECVLLSDIGSPVGLSPSNRVPSNPSMVTTPEGRTIIVSTNHFYDDCSIYIKNFFALIISLYWYLRIFFREKRK